ncbi:Hypothetical predicted protein, partial [Lynx pardinus]
MPVRDLPAASLPDVREGCISGPSNPSVQPEAEGLRTSGPQGFLVREALVPASAVVSPAGT